MSVAYEDMTTTTECIRDEMSIHRLSRATLCEGEAARMVPQSWCIVVPGLWRRLLIGSVVGQTVGYSLWHLGSQNLAARPPSGRGMGMIRLSPSTFSQIALHDCLAGRPLADAQFAAP
jgi:hypothetical protein